MNKGLLPYLHSKLGLMKEFVKSLDKNNAAFQHLNILLPALSSSKLKWEGHIRSLSDTRMIMCLKSFLC